MKQKLIMIGNTAENFNSFISIPENAEVDLYLKDNKATGTGKGDFINIRSAKTILEGLELPANTNLRDLGKLLTHIQGKNETESKEIIKKSGFLDKFTLIKDTSILATNLINLASSNQIPQIIAYLMS